MTFAPVNEHITFESFEHKKSEIEIFEFFFLENLNLKIASSFSKLRVHFLGTSNKL
jgi:hypothetical protein